MVHTKKIQIYIFLFLLGTLTIQSQTLYVKEKNGIQAPYLLSNINKISFSSGNLIVSNKTGNTNSYALTNIRYMNFKDLSTNISLPEQTESMTFSLFPNPVIDILNIRLESDNTKQVQVTISDIQGKTVYRKFIMPHESSYNICIDVTKLSKGVYLCQLYNGIKALTAKFIK